ncbi:MAG: serine/threonine protein kinase [Deltaproteobacteria bacterium]|nr:serine/threonine protein kinase [Deltaproteobacteria bacterium]
MVDQSLQTLGKYELLARIARGGMAEIYLARQTGLAGFEKLVVVKKILSHLAEEKQFVEMFLDEAIIAAKLNHPNVVQIYDLGKEGEDYYIAMEYLEGESLGFLLVEAKKRHILLPHEMAAGIVSQVCDGLAYAHALKNTDGEPLGIVHRDISPQNVIILFTGVVKLVDFGIANAAHKIHKTRTGAVKGKLSYMSPEQCLGAEVDARSDIFSLGAILWELLAGQRLFKRNTDPAVIRAIVDEPIARVCDARDDVPAELARIVDRALAREPDERFQSADEMGAALQAFIRASGRPAGVKDLAAFVDEVLAGRARTKQELLEEVRKKGIEGVSLRMLKPGSGSLPSRAGDELEEDEDEPGDEQELETLLREAPAERRPEPRTGRRTLVWLLSAALGALVLAGVSWLLLGLEEPRAGAEIPPPAPQPDRMLPPGPAVEPAAPAERKPVVARPVVVRIKSVPRDAIVMEGGKTLGKTPLDLDILAGEPRTVALAHRGYRDLIQRVEQGDAPEITVRLEAIPRKKIPGRKRKKTHKQKATGEGKQAPDTGKTGSNTDLYEF